MAKFTNSVNIQGKLYEVANIRQGQTKKGVDYIAGKIKVLTDDETQNIVTIDVFEQALNSRGESNQKYAVLKTIVETPTILDGNENPMTLRITSKLAASDFVGRDGNLATSVIQDGGFITITSQITPKAAFTVSAIMQNFQPEIVKEEETGRGIVNALVVDDFRKLPSPVKFIIEKDAMERGAGDFFESVPKNALMKVFGKVVCSSVVIKKEMKGSSWGETSFAETTINRKEYVITNADPDYFEVDEEGGVTMEELKELSQNRQTHLAEVKTRHEERQVAQKPKNDFADAFSNDLPF